MNEEVYNENYKLFFCYIKNNPYICFMNNKDLITIIKSFKLSDMVNHDSFILMFTTYSVGDSFDDINWDDGVLFKTEKSTLEILHKALNELKKS